MLHPRTSKTISQRVDLDYHRRGNGFRRLRAWASFAALAVAMLLPAWAAVGRNDRIYEAGPVSTAHQLIANQCNACHTETWTPLLRVTRLDDALDSVPDHACSVCHAGPLHHADQPSARTDCAACHREHHGQAALARVDDAYCTQCHNDLRTRHGPSEKYVRAIHDFAAHPEFALLRPPSDSSQSPEPDAYRVARPVEGKWHDRTPLRFNHRKHCGAEGLLRPDGTRRALSCEHCHQVDHASGLMRPIQHKAHCAECHANQLHFDEQRFPGQQVTHGPIDKVRGELLDRYARLVRLHPELAQDPRLVEKMREAPGGADRLSKSGWQWADDRIETALDRLLHRKQLGCRYCHTAVQEPDDDLRNWSIDDPQIPSHWFEHAKFRHDRHQLLTCGECHGAATESSQTADILLPSIERCHSCHGASAGRGAARSDCVECHVYHHGSKPMDGPLSAGLSIVKPQNVRQPPHAEAPREKEESGP
ncbi:MAG TPA: hypothetical protein VHC22_16750 [Pirellulales bacterium]|nr:hypothetical protein [Pirellulales bacterium]